MRHLAGSFSWIFLVTTLAIAGIGVRSVEADSPVNAKLSTAPLPFAIAQNPSTEALAAHLKKIGAKMYGAYWCPHCQSQKNMFGTAAFKKIDYVECDPRGENPRPNLCKTANIEGYPTWEIKGKLYPGVQSLEELTKLSNFKGSTN